MANHQDPAGSDTRPGSKTFVPFFRQWMTGFTVAWLFLTRVPLPGWWNKPAPNEKTDPQDKGIGMTPLAETVRAWPVVGLFIGAFAGLVLWGGAQFGLHPLASAFLAVIAATLITGALHEDGLADVADGFGGGLGVEKKLAIMKDSHIGTYGVLALVLITGFKVASLSGFNGPGLAAGALVAAHVLSRAVLPLMMALMTPARPGGLGTGAGTPNVDDAIVTAILGVLIALLVLGLWPGVLAAVLAGLSALAMAALANRQIGGFTGDVLGATQQITEALVIAGMAVAFRTVFYA